MNMTHNEAKQMLIDGKGTDAAWAVAQQDGGLAPGTTKQDWLRWISPIIERELESESQDWNSRYSRLHY